MYNLSERSLQPGDTDTYRYMKTHQSATDSKEPRLRISTKIQENTSEYATGQKGNNLKKNAKIQGNPPEWITDQ